MSGTTVEPDARPMADQPRAPQVVYRLLMLRNRGSELLVVSERPPFALPCVEIPRWERVAENLTVAVQKRYGISCLCLFTSDASAARREGEPPLYQVMEAREGAESGSAETRWLALDSISDHSFASGQDVFAIRHMSCAMAEFQRGKAIGPFGKPGWIEELSWWVQREIEPHGLRLTGELRQLNASPTFALLRLETSGPAVWFKAVGEPNLREFPISVMLSNLFPGFVPTVVASRPDWNGWLTTEFPGSALDEAWDASSWERAAHTLAELQMVATKHTDELLQAGGRDLRVASLLTFVDPFMETMFDLMDRQPKTPPPIVGEKELHQLGKQIKHALWELAETNIADSLGHLDFNPGNILCSADQCVFLDWAEAYVGPPFLTFQYLLEHLSRSTRQGVVGSCQLGDHYFSEWLDRTPRRAVAAARRLTPLLAVFAAATASRWTEAQYSTDESFAGYLRGLTRRMQREAGRLNAHRVQSGCA